MSTTAKAKQLAEDIKAILAKFQDEGGDDTMFADTRILTGDDVQTYLGDNCTALIAMTFDGAGHDFLSYQGEAAMMGLHTVREAIGDAAEARDFFMEDQNGWSLSFWPA